MTAVWQVDLNTAHAAAQAAAAGGDTRGFTAAIPAIIQTGDAAAAHELVTRFGSTEHLLPEHLMLLGIAGLAPAQAQEMLAACMPACAALPADVAASAAQLSGRMGVYGFSFPLWRFLTQRQQAPALLEQYGFKRIERASDVRDHSLPRHDPARDLFGVGFVREDGTWTIEYRRAYVLCACRTHSDAAAVVIRNNSYFFGRDRLPVPVYAAWEDLPQTGLHPPDDRGFAGRAAFAPWPQSLAAADDLPASEKCRRMSRLLDRLDAEEAMLSRWLCGAGAKDVAAFAARAAVPFYAGVISAAAPPWFPRHAAPVTREYLDVLRHHLTDETKIAFLSGVDGDFAAPPTGRTTVNV